MTRQKEIHQYYDALASSYDQNRFGNSYGSYIHGQEEKILRKFLTRDPKERVLSLACGTGRLMEYASLGVDFSRTMICEAEKKFPQKQFITAEANRTGLEECSIDSAFSFHLFMHLEKELCREIIEEMKRVCKPGGRFIFDFPSAKRRRAVNRRGSSWHGSTHFDMEELEPYLSGWRVVHRQGVLFLPIHRLPGGVRKAVQWVDTLLCRSLLKDYASYTVLVLEKL